MKLNPETLAIIRSITAAAQAATADETEDNSGLTMQLHLASNHPDLAEFSEMFAALSEACGVLMI